MQSIELIKNVIKERNDFMLLNDKLMSEITVNEFFAVAGYLIGFIIIGIIILYGFYEMVSFTFFLLRRIINRRDLRKELECIKKQQDL